MLSMYKIYAMVMANKIREDTGSNMIIPPNQTDFRKKISTMDIYVLSYLINKELENKGGE